MGTWVLSCSGGEGENSMNDFEVNVRGNFFFSFSSGVSEPFLNFYVVEDHTLNMRLLRSLRVL